MELTREEAIKIAIELWTWLAKTGKWKFEWDGWKDNGGKYRDMLYDCPLCQYAFEQIEGSCSYCPYRQKFNNCCELYAPYSHWSNAYTVRTRKKYAALFLEQLKQL